jgi:hypothetical protein
MLYRGKKFKSEEAEILRVLWGIRPGPRAREITKKIHNPRKAFRYALFLSVLGRKGLADIFYERETALGQTNGQSHRDCIAL